MQMEKFLCKGCRKPSIKTEEEEDKVLVSPFEIGWTQGIYFAVV